ncbi:MAG: hypothetical protein KC505_08730 [Myxococcales bacterium]|nr:hypothetical protein [Myxococcales bacterium]USN51400.1 MAG: hypothetical protein H6731_03045 [Myxococcales bacterium]
MKKSISAVSVALAVSASLAINAEAPSEEMVDAKIAVVSHDIVDGQIPKCPDGQTLKIDYEKGVYSCTPVFVSYGLNPMIL